VNEKKICLITGATSGIGFAAARELAQRGHIVLGVGRSTEKNARVEKQIKNESRNAEVEYFLADLSSQEDIRDLSKAIRSRYSSLDVLINNAGAIYADWQESPDGIEKTFALNHLGYFMLTLLLLDLMWDSAPSRIINVSSGAHSGVRLDFNDLEMKKNYDSWTAYSRSKLANIYFTYELSRRLSGSGVTVNAMSPGMVATDFGKNNPVGSVFVPAESRGSKTPEVGADTLVYLALSPEVEGVSGRYFQNRDLVETSPISHDKETAQKLWQVSLDMTGQEQTHESTV